jgi:hypothetical protein
MRQRVRRVVSVSGRRDAVNVRWIVFLWATPIRFSSSQQHLGPMAQVLNDTIHKFAFDGNETQLDMFAGGDAFNALSRRGHSVIYSACRSLRPSHSLVALLLRKGTFDINPPATSVIALLALKVSQAPM